MSANRVENGEGGLEGRGSRERAEDEFYTEESSLLKRSHGSINSDRNRAIAHPKAEHETKMGKTNSLLKSRIFKVAGRAGTSPPSYHPTTNGEDRYYDNDVLRQRSREKLPPTPTLLPPSHVRAIDRCSCCPDFCFATVFGIHMHPLNVCLFALYMCGIFLFLYAVNESVGQRWALLTSEHPSTSTSLQVHDAPSLDFPAITICNLSPHVPLELLSCKSFDHKTQCPEYHVPHVHQQHGKEKGPPKHLMNRKKNNDGNGDESQQGIARQHSLDHCLIFNNKPGDSYTTQKKGLADALVIVLRLNIDKYNKNARFSGVHINLHPQCVRARGECPDELSSSLLAAPGVPHFFRMSKHLHEHLNGTVQEYYDAKESSSGDFKFANSFGDRKDTVVLTFFYSRLSLTVVKDLPRYTWFSMMGEVGGIMGLLFGVGIINVIASLLKSMIIGKEYVNSCFI